MHSKKGRRKKEENNNREQESNISIFPPVSGQCNRPKLGGCLYGRKRTNSPFFECLRNRSFPIQMTENFPTIGEFRESKLDDIGIETLLCGLK